MKESILDDHIFHKRRTTHVRIYSDDYNEIKSKFPNVRTADYFHMVSRTNPFIQIEKILRGTNAKK